MEGVLMARFRQMRILILILFIKLCRFYEWPILRENLQGFMWCTSFSITSRNRAIKRNHRGYVIWKAFMSKNLADNIDDIDPDHRSQPTREKPLNARSMHPKAWWWFPPSGFDLPYVLESCGTRYATEIRRLARFRRMCYGGIEKPGVLSLVERPRARLGLERTVPGGTHGPSLFVYQFKTGGTEMCGFWTW